MLSFNKFKQKRLSLVQPLLSDFLFEDNTSQNMHAMEHGKVSRKGGEILCSRLETVKTALDNELLQILGCLFLVNKSYQG